MSATVSVHRRRIESVEELTRVVPTARTEVTQVNRGRLQGALNHFSIGGLPLDLGRFSLGVRSRGVVSEDRIRIGMLTGRTNRVTHWSYNQPTSSFGHRRPEHDARYCGGASVGVISLTVSDLEAIFGSEPRWREPGAWTRNHYRPAAHEGARLIGVLQEIVAGIQANGTKLGAEAAEFWKRAVVEAMTATVLTASPSDIDSSLSSALRIVGKVEDQTRPSVLNQYIFPRSVAGCVFRDEHCIGPSMTRSASVQ